MQGLDVPALVEKQTFPAQSFATALTFAGIPTLNTTLTIKVQKHI